MMQFNVVYLDDGMVNIDSPQFEYGNIRCGDRSISGIQAESDETDGLKQMCNKIADAIYEYQQQAALPHKI